MKRLVPIFFAFASCRAIVGIDHVDLVDGGTVGDSGKTCIGSCNPTLLFQRQNEAIVKLATAQDFVYALFQTSVVRCKASSPCGTTPEAIVNNTNGISDMAVGTRVFYSLLGTTTSLADGGEAPANDSAIHVTDLDGKNDTIFLGSLAASDNLALGGDLYWVDDQDDLAADPANNSVLRCPITGGCGKGILVMDKIGGPASSIVADGKSVFVLTGDQATMSVDDAVFSCAAGQMCGTMPKRLISKVDSTANNSIASDGTNLYFTSDAKGDIVKIDPTGMTKVIAGGQQGPRGIAADAMWVYWATNTGTIVRISTQGGDPQVIAQQQASPDHVTVDAQNVYFVVQSGQGSAVMKLPKP